MKLSLIGPPGAGKGTQSERIAERYDLRHLSPGELLREEIEQGTEAGRRARPYVEEGKLVPYEIVSELIARRMFDDAEKRGFVADGFPRTIEQYVRFKQELQKRDEHLDLVIYLELDREEIMKRLTGRLTCSGCGANYHETFHPPEQEGICDECGSELHRRQDDEPETIQNRIETSERKRNRLLERLERDGLLERVNANGTIQQVFDRVCERIQTHRDDRSWLDTGCVDRFCTGGRTGWKAGSTIGRYQTATEHPGHDVLWRRVHRFSNR